ncbi:PHA/PHB synthase family protein [Pseudomaricurvus alcaniphilus]|uniref:PHA/PHB synthase family protein n=1 Tax=Pseudomaricurvus alcaniphilus TaxID=1166482 RepID=UPI001A9CDB9C|nr:alpha/beta fold hydrolase [Pseudomaricurvus alcaniphilus]
MFQTKTIEFLDEAQSEGLDREFRAILARVSKGMSPVDLALATIDWATHLAISPGKQVQLLQSFFNKLADLGVYGVESLVNKDAVTPVTAIERRMSGEAWQKWPFKLFAQAHQTGRDLLEQATIGIEGVKTEHEIIVHAAAEQILEKLSPANFPLTNPEVLEATVKERGKNLARGLRFAVEDQFRRVTNKEATPDTGFKVGENVAVTPGKVVFQNDLVELIQYQPATEKVGAEPVLISPAWIMKYYILDLSPHNSLVKYLTEQGKTVFIISWKNPEKEDQTVSFEDYIKIGLMEAINAVSAICPKRKIHAVGYCIGGTLLSITAAAMARDNDDRLASISLFAAQTDFSEAGEVSRYISHSQLSFLEKVMWKRGYLTSEQMGGTFSSLRASDLVYASMVDRYLLGKEMSWNDLMSWNADGTRMPHLMHSQYLQQLYLENRLATNRFHVDGRLVSMADVRVPLYLLGTETDHVAPWHSVYKLHYLTPSELTFVLTSGGHNAGVVSGPQHPRRRYRAHTRMPGDKFMDPDTWFSSMEVQAGSWWPHWSQWLDQRMSEQVDPPAMGAPKQGYKPLRDAPGEYVLG